MVINFICRASKAGKDGLSPLELSIIINGIRKYVTLDRKVKASSFNPKTQKVRKDAETNGYLEALRAKLYNQELLMMKEGMEITIDTFIDVFKNGFKSNIITILQLFKEHNQQFQTKIDKGILASTTLDKYVVTTLVSGKTIKEFHSARVGMNPYAGGITPLQVGCSK